ACGIGSLVGPGGKSDRLPELPFKIESEIEWSFYQRRAVRTNCAWIRRGGSRTHRTQNLNRLSASLEWCSHLVHEKARDRRITISPNVGDFFIKNGGFKSKSIPLTLRNGHDLMAVTMPEKASRRTRPVFFKHRIS